MENVKWNKIVSTDIHIFTNRGQRIEDIGKDAKENETVNTCPEISSQKWKRIISKAMKKRYLSILPPI